MYPETTEKIQTRIKGNWTNTKIDWEGYGIDGTDPVEPGSDFIRPSIDWSSSEGHVGGMGKISGFGYLLIEIYVKNGNGRLKADRYAQELSDLFKFYKDGPLEFSEPSPPEKVRDKDTDWFHLNVQCDFEYNECKG